MKYIYEIDTLCKEQNVICCICVRLIFAENSLTFASDNEHVDFRFSDTGLRLFINPSMIFSELCDLLGVKDVVGSTYV